MSLPGPQLPWPAARRPLSIVAFGNSVATMQLPFRQDRSQGTYVEVLADVLAGEGVPAVPHLESKWFDFLTSAVRDYESRVRVHAPDVVIVQFGLNEYQPWLLPTGAVRHLMVQNRAATRTARAYRRYVAKRLWRWVRSYRRAVAPLVGMRTWQTTPRRFARTLDLFLRMARFEARPLMLVLDIDAPGPLLQRFLPGVVERHQVFQGLLRSVTAGLNDPEVRLVAVSEITTGLGPAAMIDSMHYTPQTHEVIGRALAAEVLSWLTERGKG